MSNPITTIDGIQCRACRECGVVKPLSEYPIVKSKRNGKPRQVRRALCTRCYLDHKNAGRRQKAVEREHVTPEAKVCPRCGIERPSSEFPKANRERDGLNTYCKDCCHVYYEANREREIERTIQWQRNNMVRHMEKQRRWERRNPEKARAVKAATAHKNRAFVPGVGGRFTSDEWLELCAKYDHRCVACGADGLLTVDHIIPISKGGSSDISNIQPLCASCNHKKHNQVIDYRVGKP